MEDNVGRGIQKPAVTRGVIAVDVAIGGAISPANASCPTGLLSLPHQAVGKGERVPVGGYM